MIEKHLPGNIAEILTRLDAWVKANRPAYYQHLLPGAFSEEIVTFEKGLGMELPAAFVAFLGWKNGQAEQEVRSFIVNYGLMSMEDITRILAVNNELLEAGDFELANWWDKLWLPFLQDYAGNYWCIDFRGSFEGQPGQIITFWHDDEARDILFGSFADFLATTLHILENMGQELGSPERHQEFWNRVEHLNPGYPKEYSAG